MPKYVIEREIPGVGALSTAEFQAISQKSCNVLRGMGPASAILSSTPPAVASRTLLHGWRTN